MEKRWNEKGKKYYNGYNDRLKFKAEYLNSIRNGKGKEYYDNSRLTFEGEYLNEDRIGKGKNILYNGKFL